MIIANVTLTSAACTPLAPDIMLQQHTCWAGQDGVHRVLHSVLDIIVGVCYVSMAHVALCPVLLKSAF